MQHKHNKHIGRIIVLFIIIFSGNIFSQKIYRTQIFDENIKTLQAGVNDEKYLSPIIDLNGNDIIKIKFDEMSHEAHMFGYKIIHCNADWTPSGLNTNEYLGGYTSADITDFELSEATTFLYTHYKFELPNSDMSFKVSGNYVAVIYEDNQYDKPVAQVCFSIVDPQVSVTGNVRSNTDIELSNRLQQVDFDVHLNGYNVRDVNSEIKVYVRQNNRFDNEVSNIQPTFINGNTLKYINNRALIFEGGNEYHSFDISSIYSASDGIDRIKYNQPHYEVFLTQDKIQTSKNYINNFDVNGKFVINYQEAMDNSDIEGDYMYVHFMLPVEKPFFDGQVYLGGEFNYNLLNDNSRLNYDFNSGMYYKTLLLKQGGYNYQYWFVPKGQNNATVERIDGSFWQTGNEYTIYVYNHPFGERYDKLIAVKSL
ncbi:MAG: DUF5103 domain-containing protein [Paludibacter sp.]|nr:DUF5103 domain-containing protein [Paludibacter sp.]